MKELIILFVFLKENFILKIQKLNKKSNKAGNVHDYLFTIFKKYL
jgi:hypothetical protein